jgi:hypothetical protein
MKSVQLLKVADMLHVVTFNIKEKYILEVNIICTSNSVKNEHTRGQYS